MNEWIMQPEEEQESKKQGVSFSTVSLSYRSSKTGSSSLIKIWGKSRAEPSRAGSDDGK